MATVRSVGAVIMRNGRYLLVERKNPPLGFAGVAGHVEDGQPAEDALRAEVAEESGLRIVSFQELFEEFLSFDQCRHHRQGHFWTVFSVTGALAEL